MENGIYSDPNAYIKREIVKPKQKVDLMHIEKVMYPVNYDNFSCPHHDKTAFDNKQAQEPQQHKSGPNFDISKLLPLLTGGKGNLNSMLPGLLSGLGVNKDILPLLNNFTNLNKPKKVEAKVVETANTDSISKYKRVEK